MRWLLLNPKHHRLFEHSDDQNYSYTTYGYPARTGNPYYDWKPMDRLKRHEKCNLCWQDLIPIQWRRARGTFCWYDAETGLYECKGCHVESA